MEENYLSDRYQLDCFILEGDREDLLRLEVLPIMPEEEVKHFVLEIEYFSHFSENIHSSNYILNSSNTEKFHSAFSSVFINEDKTSCLTANEPEIIKILLIELTPYEKIIISQFSFKPDDLGEPAAICLSEEHLDWHISLSEKLYKRFLVRLEETMNKVRIAAL